MSRFSFAAFVVGMSLAVVETASAAFFDTILIGNAGNAAKEVGFTPTDTRWYKAGSFGAVSYSYRIGSTEVTNDHYVRFLNAVASTDPLQLYNSSMESVGAGRSRFKRHSTP